MDLNARLDRALRCARRVLLDGVGEESGRVHADAVKEMAKDLLALDKALFHGGHLLKRWSAPAAKVEKGDVRITDVSFVQCDAESDGTRECPKCGTFHLRKRP